MFYSSVIYSSLHGYLPLKEATQMSYEILRNTAKIISEKSKRRILFELKHPLLVYNYKINRNTVL